MDKPDPVLARTVAAQKQEAEQANVAKSGFLALFYSLSLNLAASLVRLDLLGARCSALELGICAFYSGKCEGFCPVTL
jgi:hypothetical protein